MNEALPVIIRRATAQDLDSITHCVEKAYEGYISRVGKRPASMDANFAPLLKDGFIWVADLDNEILGLMVVIENPKAFEIQSVAVLPEVQRRGIGRKLLSLAEDLALQKGCRTLRLYTNTAVPELVTYYAALGYVEEKRGYDRGYHRVYMSKTLPSSGSDLAF